MLKRSFDDESRHDTSRYVNAQASLLVPACVWVTGLSVFHKHINKYTLVHSVQIVIGLSSFAVTYLHRTAPVKWHSNLSVLLHSSEHLHDPSIRQNISIIKCYLPKKYILTVEDIYIIFTSFAIELLAKHGVWRCSISQWTRGHKQPKVIGQFGKESEGYLYTFL